VEPGHDGDGRAAGQAALDVVRDFNHVHVLASSALANAV
jgi:hypothetical protein